MAASRSAHQARERVCARENQRSSRAARARGIGHARWVVARRRPLPPARAPPHGHVASERRLECKTHHTHTPANEAAAPTIRLSDSTTRRRRSLDHVHHSTTTIYTISRPIQGLDQLIYRRSKIGDHVGAGVPLEMGRARASVATAPRIRHRHRHPSWLRWKHSACAYERVWSDDAPPPIIRAPYATAAGRQGGVSVTTAAYRGRCRRLVAVASAGPVGGAA